MSNICSVCGNEMRHEEYHRMYRRCDLCNTKHAIKYYYNKKDKILEQKENYHHNSKELFSQQIENE